MTPQAAANNRTTIHNRGKALGGSSAIYLLIWNRAIRREYDVKEELGNKGYGTGNPRFMLFFVPKTSDAKMESLSTVRMVLTIEHKVDISGVGENLQDHLRIQTTYELRPNITGLDILRYNQTRAAIELDLWRRKQTSLYQYSGSCYGFFQWPQTTINTSHLLSLARSTADPTNAIDSMKLSLISDPHSRAPDLQVVFGDGYVGTHGYPALGTPGHSASYATLLAGVMHPFARGSIHIVDASASSSPAIDPRYLSNAFDLEAAKQAAKYLRQMATSSPFKELWVTEFDPGSGTQSDAGWEAYVRENMSTFHHPLITCEMLPKADGGVVGDELRVYGGRDPGVVDANVIPIMISANIQTAAYGVVERGAEIILGEYR
jgi:choline dehydrogenase-like flavoprotein